MCSDVVVYPYQIYQARLAGADAIKLFAPALPDKVNHRLAWSFRVASSTIEPKNARQKVSRVFRKLQHNSNNDGVVDDISVQPYHLRIGQYGRTLRSELDDGVRIVC